MAARICLVVCCDGWGSRGVAIVPSASEWLSHLPQTNGGGVGGAFLRWVRPPQLQYPSHWNWGPSPNSSLTWKGHCHFKSDKNKVVDQTSGSGFLVHELVPLPSPVLHLGINPSSASQGLRVASAFMTSAPTPAPCATKHGRSPFQFPSLYCALNSVSLSDTFRPLQYPEIHNVFCVLFPRK